MLPKIHLYSDFGLLKSNLAFVFAHRFASIAKISVSDNPIIGNTLDIGER